MISQDFFIEFYKVAPENRMLIAIFTKYFYTMEIKYFKGGKI